MYEGIIYMTAVKTIDFIRFNDPFVLDFFKY